MRKFTCIIDTETTLDDKIFDFAAVIVDRQGSIHHQMAVIIRDYIDHELFYDKNAIGLWSKKYASEKRITYNVMIDKGERMIASVNAVNRWLSNALGKYAGLELTAYNLPFDADKCKKSGIDLSGFTDTFCLWQGAIGSLCKRKAYHTFALDNHCFNNVTQKTRSCTISTSAETVASFLNGSLMVENHDALSDVLDFELPIFRKLLKIRKWRENAMPYNYRDFQVKNHFVAK